MATPRTTDLASFLGAFLLPSVCTYSFFGVLYSSAKVCEQSVNFITQDVFHPLRDSFAGDRSRLRDEQTRILSSGQYSRANRSWVNYVLINILYCVLPNISLEFISPRKLMNYLTDDIPFHRVDDGSPRSSRIFRESRDFWHQFLSPLYILSSFLSLSSSLYSSADKCSFSEDESCFSGAQIKEEEAKTPRMTSIVLYNSTYI